MELKEFISNVADLFEETDRSEIQSETVFQDLDEWGSLFGLSIIGMISDEYDVSVNGADIRNCETINELYLLVNSKKGE